MKIGALFVCIAAACGCVLAHDALPDGAGNDASQQAWQDYSDSLREKLVASGRPRDWTLAAVMLNFDDLANMRADARSLFERASRSASEDAVVQWTTAVYRIGNAPHLVLRDQADENVRALLRIEPDNAAAWMLSLILASARAEAGGVDEALRGMASADRFDDHFVAIVHAWFDAYDRYTPPPIESEDPATQSVDASTAAFAQAAATILAPYQVLPNTCRPGSPIGDTWYRRAYCIEAARLMLDRGNTLVARSIGFSVLRNLAEATPQDQQQRRDVDWLRNAGSEAALSLFERDLAGAATHFADWRSLDDENEVMRRALARAGLPATAPGFWVAPTHALAHSAASN